MAITSRTGISTSVVSVSQFQLLALKIAQHIRRLQVGRARKKPTHRTNQGFYSVQVGE
jgi:hypothetical protein